MDLMECKVLKNFLGWDVPLGPWNPCPIPDLVQLNWFLVPYTRLTHPSHLQILPNPRVTILQKLLRSLAQSSQNKVAILFLFLSSQSCHLAQAAS